MPHITSPYRHVCPATQGCVHGVHGVHGVHIVLEHTKCRDMAVDGCCETDDPQVSSLPNAPREMLPCKSGKCRAVIGQSG